MTTYSVKTFKLFLALLYISVWLTPVTGQGTSTNRENGDVKKAIADMANSHSATYTESLRFLFSLPPNRFDDILSALTSSNMQESKGAQLLVRYLGDSELFNRMLEACKSSQCFLSGPVPVPLQPLDIKELEYLLSNRDMCKLGEFEMKYIYAIFFDDAARSREFRKKVEERAYVCSSDSILRTRIMGLRIASEKDSGIELANSLESIRTSLFFLTEQERERAKLQFLGFNARSNRALFEIFVDNGVLATRYFHVVLVKNDKKKWRFNSVTTVSQS